MGIIRIGYICIIGVFLSIQVLYAQRDTIYKIDNTYYKTHIVKKQQTLYSISKKYGVDIEDIVDNNHGVLEQLHIGRVLYIPIKRRNIKKQNDNYLRGDTVYHIVQAKENLYRISKKYDIDMGLIRKQNGLLKNDILSLGDTIFIIFTQSSKEKNYAVYDSIYMIHTVKPKETLYKISKQYDLSIDSIKQHNSILQTQDLKYGMALRIPKTVIIPEHISIPLDTMENVIKNVYKIAVMLPLFLEKNVKYQKINKKHLPITEDGIQLLNGLLLGMEENNSTKTMFQYSVYDVTDTTDILNIIRSGGVDTFDMIIGPLYFNQFQLLKQYIAQHTKKTILVNLFNYNDSVLGEEFVLKCVPSVLTQVEYLIPRLLTEFKGENIIVVDYNTDSSVTDTVFSDMIEQNIQHLDTILDSIDSLRTHTAILSCNQQQCRYLDRIVDTGRTNIFLIPYNDKVIVERLTNALQVLRNTEQFRNIDVVMVGLDFWTKLHKIDAVMKNIFKWRIACHMFIDYRKENIQAVIRKYRKLYYQDPENIGILGYGIGNYLGAYLNKIGISSKKEDIENVSIHNIFPIRFVQKHTGYENQGLEYLQYYDFRFHKKKP